MIPEFQDLEQAASISCLCMLVCLTTSLGGRWGGEGGRREGGMGVMGFISLSDICLIVK